MTDKQIKEQLSIAMPDMVKAMRMKVQMYTREIGVVKRYAVVDNATGIHLQVLLEDRDKLIKLIRKLEG